MYNIQKKYHYCLYLHFETFDISSARDAFCMVKQFKLIKSKKYNIKLSISMFTDDNIIQSYIFIV